MTSAIQLTKPNIIWQRATNGLLYNNTINVTLPLNITLYNTTANIVAVATNGVSHFLKFTFGKNNPSDET
jgi:hypothetical protein